MNSHPRICVPYEAHIYNVFWPWRHHYEPLNDTANLHRLVRDVLAMRVFRDWSNPPSVEAVLQRIRRQDFHGVYEAVLRAWADGQGKPRWGEKTPHNTLFWRAIHEGFPEAKFIHIVRDGRDCALSTIDARFGPKLVYPAALRWHRYLNELNRMTEALGPERVFTLKYEDLLTDPDYCLRSLCEFLGEAYDPAMLEYHRGPDVYMTDRRNRDNLRQPVLSSNKAKWRKRMNSRMLRQFEAVAADNLKNYGYPLSQDHPVVSAWEHVICLYLLHPPLRLLAMARNPKGWVDGLVRLKIRGGILVRDLVRVFYRHNSVEETAHSASSSVHHRAHQ